MITEVCMSILKKLKEGENNDKRERLKSGEIEVERKGCNRYN